MSFVARGLRGPERQGGTPGPLQLSGDRKTHVPRRLGSDLGRGHEGAGSTSRARHANVPEGVGPAWRNSRDPGDLHRADRRLGRLDIPARDRLSAQPIQLGTL